MTRCLQDAALRDSAGVLIEGVPGAGKSSVIDCLLKHPRFIERGYASALILSEHHTQRVLEPKEAAVGLRPRDNLDLLAHLVSVVSGLVERLGAHDWAAHQRVRHRLCYLLERFHLTHVAHYQHMSWDLVADVDAELAGLGCRLCILRADPEAVVERLAGRGEAWHRFVRGRARARQSERDYYAEQQDHFLHLAGASELPSVVFDTTDLTPEEVASRVVDLWSPDWAA